MSADNLAVCREIRALSYIHAGHVTLTTPPEKIQ